MEAESATVQSITGDLRIWATWALDAHFVRQTLKLEGGWAKLHPEYVADRLIRPVTS